MEKNEMLKLLSYEDKKIIVEGEDLVELANMYHLSVVNFLELFEYYLISNQKSLTSGYHVGTTNSIILEDPKEDYTIKNVGEILVPAHGYEAMKKQIFDFAYTKCSNLGDKKFDHMGLDCSETYHLGFKIKITNQNPEYYSCIYKSSRVGWNEKVSNVLVDKEDQEKRYSLIKR